VTLKLREARACIALHAYGSISAEVASQGPIDDLEVCRVFVQAHFKIQDRRPACATGVLLELDVKDAVRRGAADGSEYPLPAGAVCVVKVVPEHGDQVGHAGGGQANTSGRGVIACKLQVAVG